MRPHLTPRDIERFWNKVDRSGGPDACWPFTGKIKRGETGGYGIFTVYRGQEEHGFRAHRVAYFAAHGTWPEHYACHYCDNPPCCNPAHLFDGTAKDNAVDCARKGRTLSQTRPDVRRIKERHGSHLHPEVRSGERNGNAVLTNEVVLAMRADYAKGGVTFKTLGAKYGVTKATAHKAVRGRSWRSP